jgi:hypothetical protein
LGKNTKISPKVLTYFKYPKGFKIANRIDLVLFSKDPGKSPKAEDLFANMALVFFVKEASCCVSVRLSSIDSAIRVAAVL